jgi:hypothetical protein
MNSCLTMLAFKKEKTDLEQKLIKQKFNGN